MDKGTLIGVLLGCFFLLATVALAASFDIGPMMSMFDVAGFILVFGGTMCSVMIGKNFDIFLTSMKATKVIFKPPVVNPALAINQIVDLANTARKEGVLALEDSAANMDDEFLKKGIMLIVDGTDPELVKGIMETEISYIEERHGNISGAYELMGSFFPAWGMMGTVIGLIVMLQDLADADAIAINMSLALVTTLYGCLFSNFYALPFASKLKQLSSEEMLLKTVLIEGMLSIQAGENPRIIEEKLKSFLAPAMRDNVGEVGAAGAGAGATEAA